MILGSDIALEDIYKTQYVDQLFPNQGEGDWHTNQPSHALLRMALTQVPVELWVWCSPDVPVYFRVNGDVICALASSARSVVPANVQDC